MALTNFQYVTMVAAGGTPVRLADQNGANLPTTGQGSLVFSDGATLTNVTIDGIVHDTPLGLDNGSVTVPSLYFGTADRGLYSRGNGDISFTSNAGRLASITTNATELLFTTTGTEIKLFSDTNNETVIQGYNNTATTTKQLTLQKYGSNVVIGAALSLQAGGLAGSGNLLLTGDGVGLYAGTGAPTLSAARGSLYMRNDNVAGTPGMPYANQNGTTTWQQLMGLTATQSPTNKTLSTVTNTFTGTGASATTFLRGDNTWAVVSGAGISLTVGATLITGGATTRILYDNAGVLGEYTISGSGTVVAMQTGAALITPALGVATATSIAIGGATIGANGLAITGTVLFNSAITYGGVTLSNAVTGTGNMVLSAGATLTGVPVAPTAAIGNNSTQISTTAYADRAGLANLIIIVTEFTSSGTWTPNANMVWCEITTTGGGGGSGGSAGSAGFDNASGSGGAGGTSTRTLGRASVTPSQTVTIGAAGAAGASGFNAGGAGGTTSVGSLCIANGGGGGAGANGSTAAAITGGKGGVLAGAVGDRKIAGGDGGGGLLGTITTFIGSGMPGGASYWGGGGRGVNLNNLGGGTGDAGVAYGSGGGASGTYNAGGNFAGVVGAVGYVTITEYCKA